MTEDKSLKESINSEESSVGDGPWQNPRLTKDVLPEKYMLFLHPKIHLGIFEGIVSINISVVTPLFCILIHQTNLTIISTKLSNCTTSEDVEIEKTWSFPKNHYWVIQLKEQIEPGNFMLFMAFKGKLSSSTLGLYKSTYKDAANEDRSCILSYFEATYARSAFPCFDEPSFRAVFNIKITHEANEELVALSNMCKQKEIMDHPSSGLKTVFFKSTPPLPPYLTAFVIGDFYYTKPIVTKRNVSVAVYSRPEIIIHMKKTQEYAVSVLEFFENYFDVPFALPKLDLIALPDSNIGGMENWGLITFREDRLINKNDSTCDDLLNLYNVVSHEISHMWFGDLVTISWWDNLWLKEGFATFMESVACSHFFPEWYNDWVQIEDSNGALCMDATLDSHPLVQTVNTTAEIREVFDSISYCKGAAIIRMLENLDPEGFQSGIVSYLKRYTYSSTETQNLWNELQENVQFDVSSFMDTWTRQMGFPVLNVECIVGSRVAVSQSRFLENKHLAYDETTSPFEYKWNVPIKYITSNDLVTPKLAWLNKDQESVALECGDRPGWVKLNWHQVGFYRVNYTSDQWELFSVQLLRNPAALDVEDRANLIGDAFNLARAGYFTYNIPLNLLRYFKHGKEKHFFPWAVAFPHLHYIGQRLLGTEAHCSFLRYIQTQLKSYLTESIWDFGESVPYLQKKLQLELIKYACWSEERKTLFRIRQIFNEWLDDKIPPHPELRPIVYSYALGSDVPHYTWLSMLTYTIEKVTDVKEKLDLWCALGSVRNEEYLLRLIEHAKDPKKLKSQDFFIVIDSIAKHPNGLQAAWNFLRAEWEYLVDRFTLEDPKFCRTMFKICSQFDTEEKLNETNEFFSRYPEAGSSARLRKMALQKIQLNIEWTKQNSEMISKWLESFESDDFYNPRLDNFVELRVQEFFNTIPEGSAFTSAIKMSLSQIICNTKWKSLFHCQTLEWIEEYLFEEAPSSDNEMNVDSDQFNISVSSAEEFVLIEDDEEYGI